MDLGEILSSLSNEDMEQLKNTANELMGKIQQEQPNRNKAVNDDITSAVDTIGKLINMRDDRYNLIMALKPMLSPERQKKADDAAKILRLIALVPALKDSGLLNGII